ncbi:hypothetical protein PybrP1_007944 [[Pythium] brassicae (nom. inval.)]|nr:hypothetical protein PybrP1_007944 [[Pythium] brassicae (nom. inval.)]
MAATADVDAPHHTPSCSVCLEEKDYNGSALVRCASCALPVHVRCYGTSLPADGAPWRCEACLYEQDELPDESLVVDAAAHATATAAGAPRLRPRCVVCPVEGGALRRTSQPGVWVHVLCVNWIPELSHSLTGELNQAVNIALLDRSRETLRCLVCGQRGGCIQCVSGRCARAFHVLCAIRSPSTLIFTGYNGANQQVYHCKAHLADVAAAKYEMVDDAWRYSPRMLGFLAKHPAVDGKCRVCQTKTAGPGHALHETQCLLAWLTREELKHRAEEMKRRGLKAAAIAYTARGKSQGSAAARKHSKSAGASPALKKRQHAALRPCPECGDTVREALLASHLQSGCTSLAGAGASADTRRAAHPNRLKRKMSAHASDFAPADEPALLASDLSDVLFATWPGQHAGAPMDTTALWRTVNSSFYSSKALMKKRMEQLCKGACGAKLEDIGNFTRKPARHDLMDCADTVLLERMATSADGANDNDALQLKANLHRCDFMMRASRSRCVEDIYAQPSMQIHHVGPATTTADDDAPLLAAEATVSAATQTAALADDAAREIRVQFANSEDVAVDCTYALTLRRGGVADRAPPADGGLFWSAFRHDELSTLAGAAVEAFRVPLGPDDRLWLSMEMMMEEQADDSTSATTMTTTTTTTTTTRTSNLPAHLLLPAASDELSLTDELTPEISLLVETLNEQMKQNRFRLRALSKKLQLTDHVEGLAKRAAGVTELYYKEFAAWKRLCKSLTTGYKDAHPGEPRATAATPAEPKKLQKTQHQKRHEADASASAAHDNGNDNNNDNDDEAIDDGTCVVCFDGQSPETNPIVFCDRCDLAVHQGCYGLVQLPNNEFFCDRCSIEDRGEDPAGAVFCQLCPLRDGAFKRTVDGKWVHVVCALWCPKVWIGNLQSLSEIHLVAATSNHARFVDPTAEVSARLALPAPTGGSPTSAAAALPHDDDGDALVQGSLCMHCKVACGRTVQCVHPGCAASFHPLCGWFEGLPMSIALGARGLVYAGGGAGLRFQMHCVAHLPANYPSAERLAQRRRRRKFRIDAFYLTQCKLDRAPPPRSSRGPARHESSSLLAGPILQALLAADGKRADEPDAAPESYEWVDRAPCSACFQFSSPVVAADTADALDVNALHKRQFLMRCQYCSTFVHPECCLSETGAPADIFKSNWICERCTMVGDATPTPCVVCDKPCDYLMPCSTSSSSSAGGNGGTLVSAPAGAYDKWVHVFCAKWAKAKLIRKNRVLCAQAPSLSADGHAFRCELCSFKGRNLASCAHCSKRFHPLCAAKQRLYVAKSAKQEWKFYCDAHPPAGVVYDERRQSWMTAEILSQLQDLRRSLERGRMILEMARQRDRQQKRILNVHQLPFMAASLEIVLKKRPTPAMREAFEALTGEVLVDTPRRARPQRTPPKRSRAPARAAEPQDDSDDEEHSSDPAPSTRATRGKRQEPAAPSASSGTSAKRRRLLELDLVPASPPSSPGESGGRRRSAGRAKPDTSAAHDLRGGVSPAELKRRLLGCLERATATAASDFDGVVAALYPELVDAISSASSSLSSSDTIRSNEDVHNYDEWELGFEIAAQDKRRSPADEQETSSADASLLSSPTCSQHSQAAHDALELEPLGSTQSPSSPNEGAGEAQEWPSNDVDALEDTDAEASEDGRPMSGDPDRTRRPGAATDTPATGSVKRSIQVFVRVRPLSTRDCESGDESPVVRPGDDANSLRVQSASSHGNNCVVTECCFDQVFMDRASQDELFAAVESSVRASLDGYNATVFAYGQTGTGKTHTIFGEDADIDAVGAEPLGGRVLQPSVKPAWGIIPRALALLLDQAETLGTAGVSVSLQLSFMQIYNDRVFDLLTDRRRQRPLSVREQPTLEGGTSVVLQGLSSERVATMDAALQLLKRGRTNRSVRETELNSSSSRSHAIVQITAVSERSLATGERVARNGVSELQIAKAQIAKLRERLESEQRRCRQTRVKEHEAAHKDFTEKLRLKEKELQRLARDNTVFSRWREEDVRRIRELESRVKELEAGGPRETNASSDHGSSEGALRLKGCVLCAVRDPRPPYPSAIPSQSPTMSTSAGDSSSVLTASSGSAPTATTDPSGSRYQPFPRREGEVSASNRFAPLAATDAKCAAHSLTNCVLCAGAKTPKASSWQPTAAAARASIKELAFDNSRKSYQALIREASDAAALALRRK